MPDSRALEELIQAARPRVEGLKASAEHVRPDLRMGCGLGLLLPAVGLLLAFVLPVPWPLKLAGLVAGAIGGAIGVPRLIRFGQRARTLKAPFEEQVIRPFVDLLVPGAVLSRDRVDMRDWNRARLFQTGIGGWNASARITGTIAGLPAVLDETWWSRQNMEWSFGGWIVRFELPFAVAGHLRVRFRRDEKRVVTNGFETLPEPTARLGDAYTVDVGPLEGETLPGIDATTLVTDDFIEWIRTDPGTQVAVAGRELWVALGSEENVFLEQVVNFDLESFRRAARRFERAEAIARAVVAAGAARR
jgi:hypothetical protein